MRLSAQHSWESFVVALEIGLIDAIVREILRTGDRAGRAHDLQDLVRREAVLACMGRSNVTLSALVVPLSTILLAPTVPVAATTWVLVTCGPTTIRGDVF